MLSERRRGDLARLALLHHRRDRALTAHAHEGDALGAAFHRLGVGHGVRAVGVAAARRGDDVLRRACDARDGLPARAVALEVAHQRGIDDVLLQAVQEDRPDEATVLADLVDHRVGGAGEDDVLVDARDLVGRPGPAEEVLVDVGLPRGSAGTPACTTCSPCRRGSSRRGRRSPRVGTACRHPLRRCTPARRGGTRSHSLRIPCTVRTSRPRRTGASTGASRAACLRVCHRRCGRVEGHARGRPRPSVGWPDGRPAVRPDVGRAAASAPSAPATTTGRLVGDGTDAVPWPPRARDGDDRAPRDRRCDRRRARAPRAPRT